MPADGEGPLYDQIAGAIRRAISTGELRPGERLPPARELAGAIDVNLHTVLRAYALLREDGLIDVRRGRGAVVRDDAPAGQADVHELAVQLLAEARRAGLSRRELLSLIERLPA